MNADERRSSDLLSDETYAIIGCAFEVYNQLGHGLKEKLYENALVVEFGLRGIPFKQQPVFPVSDKGQPIGDFVPDLITFDSVVIDTKTVERISDIERGQVLSYLRITNLQVGLIINFKHPKLEWQRLALSR